MSTAWQTFKCGPTERVLDSVTVAQGPQFIYVDDVLEAFKISSADRFEVNGRTLSYMRDDHGTMYHPKRIPCHPSFVIQVILESSRSESTLSLSKIAPSTPGLLNEFADQLNIKDAPTNTTLARRTTTQLKSLKSAVIQANHSGRALNAEAMQDLIGKHLVPTDNNDNTLQYLTQNVNLLVRDVGELKQQGNVLEQLARKMIDMQQQALDRMTLIQSKTEAILTQQLELAEYPIPRLFIVLPEEVTEYDPRNWFRTKFRLHFICECGKHTESADSKVRHHLHLAKHEGYIVREPTKLFKKYGPFLLLMLEMIKFGTSVAGHVVPTLASLKAVEFVDSIQQSVESVTAKIDYSLECIDNQLNKLQESTSATDRFVDGEVQPTMTQQDLTNYLNDVEGLEGVELRQLGSFLKTSTKDNLLGNLYRMTTSEGNVKWVCLDHFRFGYQVKQVQKLREAIQHARGEFDEQQGKIKISLTSSIIASAFYGVLNKTKGIFELDLQLDWNCTKGDIDMLEGALRNTSLSILRLDLQRFRTSFGNQLLPASSLFGVLFRLQEMPSMRFIHVVLPQEFIIKVASVQPKTTFCPCKLSFELATAKIEGKELALLATAIQINSTLTSINLAMMWIGDTGAELISRALKTNSTLKTLDLTSNRIKSKGAQALSEALVANSTLTTLCLESNSIERVGALAMFAVLKANSTLASLDMTDTSINLTSLTTLSEALGTNSSLSTLKLKGNHIPHYNIRTLCEALKTNTSLITLSLARNKVEVEGTHALSEVLKTNSTLTNLDLYGCRIEENEACIIFEALKSNSTLTALNWNGNSVRVKGCRSLSEMLKVNTSLADLNLTNTFLGFEGAAEMRELRKNLEGDSNPVILQWERRLIGEEAEALFEALKVNSVLVTLNLSRNALGDKGAQMMSEILKTNSTLNTLDFRENHMTSIGASRLSEALKTNTTLTTLILNCNSIKNEGAKALAEVLKINKSLTTIGLMRTGIEDDGAQVLFEALKTNATLMTLDMMHNAVSGFGAQVLFEALKTNSTLANLNLHGNIVGVGGVDATKALSDALKINSTLNTLDLYFNGLTADCAQIMLKLSKTSRCNIKYKIEKISIRDL